MDISVSGRPEPAFEPDGSLFEEFIQENRDFQYYAFIPGEGDETMLVMARTATYLEASPPEIPADGYYASDITLYRYESGAVTEAGFFHSMTLIQIDMKNRVLYRFWGGQGYEEDIAEPYLEYDAENMADSGDVLSLEVETEACTHNGDVISKAEYDKLVAERDALCCGLQVFPVDRDGAAV